MSLFLCLSLISLRRYGQKIVKSWRFRKKGKKVGNSLSMEVGGLSKPRHYVPSQSGFRSFWLKVSQEGIYRHHFDFLHADRNLKNKETENLLMFDAEMGRPKFCRKFRRWLLIGFDLWILWISILKKLLILTLRMRYLKLCIFDIQFCPAECEIYVTSFLKFMFP